MHPMPKPESASTRLPRGTKPVAQAFLTALDAVPEASRAAVSKASLGMIRDELKSRREVQRAARSGLAAPTKTARRAQAVPKTRAKKRGRIEAGGVETGADETASRS